MNPEDNLLFTCTRQHFLAEHQQRIRDICRREMVDWDRIYTIARDQGVAALIYTNLQQCPAEITKIPAAVQQKFEQYYYYNVARKTKLADLVRQVITFFNRLGIDLMLIKGIAVDILVYETPWYTALGDVDLVIRPRREALSEQTVTRIETFLADYKGFEYDFFEHHDVTMNRMLPVDFHTIWGGARQIVFKDQPVWVMAAEDMLLAACINSCRKRFLRLKSLADIAEIIHTCRDLDWMRFNQKADLYQCQSIAYAALWVTHNTVGCPSPPTIFTDLSIAPARAAIIRRLSRHMSFTSLSSLQTGPRILGRTINPALLLPYAVYGPTQLWRKMQYLWRSLSSPQP